MDNIYKQLAKLIKDSKHTVILTGAGMSTESGIPDFRSKQGIWKKYDPNTVASVNAMLNDYMTFHEFYSLRDKTKREHFPHKGYYILKEWENKGYIKAVITQNVDGFHLEAGNKYVYEIHGSIRNFLCIECGEKASREDFTNLIPCKVCGGRLRPGIVLFGEALPENIVIKSIEAIEKSDLVIVIGTSLKVYPAAGMYKRTKGKVVYINDVNESNRKFDLVILGKAGEVLQAVNAFM